MKKTESKPTKPFNVIILDFNNDKFVPYDVMPYFVQEYNDAKDKPTTVDEFKKFIEDASRYRFWSRCEYEVVLHNWPCDDIKRKIDVHEQVMMNIDIVTTLLMDSVFNKK